MVMMNISQIWIVMEGDVGTNIPKPDTQPTNRYRFNKAIIEFLLVILLTTEGLSNYIYFFVETIMEIPLREKGALDMAKLALYLHHYCLHLNNIFWKKTHFISFTSVHFSLFGRRWE